MSAKGYEGRRELRWRWSEGTLITYVEAASLSDDLWNTWLAAVEDPRTKCLLLCAWEASRPSTAQWRKFTNVIKEQGLAVAVVTEDRHNAALAKKAAWVGAKIDSFKWGDNLYDALVFLGFDLETRRRINPLVIGLRDRFGQVDGSSSGPGQARSMPVWMREGSKQQKSETRTLPSIEQRPPAASVRPAKVTTSTARSETKTNSLSAEFRRSRDAVFQSSSDIQAKLAEVQARLRARNLEARRSRQ